MKKFILIFALITLPSICFGQAGVVRSILKQGAKLVSKETAKRAAEKKSVDAAKIALGKATTKSEKVAAKKALQKAEKDAAQGAIARATTYDAKLVIGSISKTELAGIATDLNLAYPRIKFSPELVEKTLNFCKANKIKSTKAYNEMIDQIDRYSGVLLDERKHLLQKSVLNDVEKARLVELESLFMKNENALKSSSTSALFDRLTKTGYKETDMLTLKDFSHIVLRHGARSTEKSSFNVMDNKLIDEIVKVAKNNTNYVANKDGVQVFIKKCETPIGVTQEGLDANYLVVWVDKNTKKITSAFPADKTYKFVQLFEANRKSSKITNVGKAAAITTSVVTNDNVSEKEHK